MNNGSGRLSDGDGRINNGGGRLYNENGRINNGGGRLFYQAFFFNISKKQLKIEQIHLKIYKSQK